LSAVAGFRAGFDFGRLGLPVPFERLPLPDRFLVITCLFDNPLPARLLNVKYRGKQAIQWTVRKPVVRRIVDQRKTA
jgi:hypothetical protein